MKSNFAIFPIWLRRWHNLGRIKTKDTLHDERLVQVCKEYINIMACKRMKQDESMRATLISIPSQDSVKVIRALYEVIDLISKRGLPK